MWPLSASYYWCEVGKELQSASRRDREREESSFHKSKRLKEREQTTEVLSEIDREKKEAARIKNGN